jgi:hypothetical protein
MVKNTCGRGTLSLALILIAWPGSNARGADFVFNLGLDTLFSSNVFLDESREWDLILRPTAEAGVDFGEYWSVGYSGEVNAFTQNRNLFSHWHELYLFANPAWGPEGENEFTSEVRVQALLNTNVYRTINLIHPAWLNKLVLEPRSWFRCQLSLDASFLWFFEDTASNSFDLWAYAETSFVLPSKTTLSPRIGYGLRVLTSPDTATAGSSVDRVDNQLSIGLHIGQSLWTNAGLQLTATYLPPLGTSALLQQKLTQAQFVYLGEDFLFSGIRARVLFKQLFGRSWAVEASFQVEQRRYSGWPALDSAGAVTGSDRKDLRWMPRLAVRYTWVPEENQAGPAWLEEVSAGIEYAWLRQQSNSAWYDTDANLVAVSVGLGW